MYTAAMRAGLYRPKKRSVISRVDHTTATACHPRGRRNPPKSATAATGVKVFWHRCEAAEHESQQSEGVGPVRGGGLFIDWHAMPGVVFLQWVALEFSLSALDSATNNPWHHGLMSVETPPPFV